MTDKDLIAMSYITVIAGVPLNEVRECIQQLYSERPVGTISKTIYQVEKFVTEFGKLPANLEELGLFLISEMMQPLMHKQKTPQEMMDMISRMEESP